MSGDFLKRLSDVLAKWLSDIGETLAYVESRLDECLHPDFVSACVSAAARYKAYSEELEYWARNFLGPQGLQLMEKIDYVGTNIDVVEAKCKLAQTSGGCVSYREVLTPLRRVKTGVEVIRAMLTTSRETASQAPPQPQPSGHAPVPPTTAPTADSPQQAPQQISPHSPSPPPPPGGASIEPRAAQQTPPPQPQTPTQPPRMRPARPLAELNKELLEAVRAGDVQRVRELLEAGANPNARDKDGLTPLHWAASEGHADIVKILLEHGADPNTKIKYGWTPLHYASREGHADVVKLLLEHGADPNTKKDDGLTPLHVAAFSGHADVVKLLLEHGADPNARNYLGWTPLDVAEGQVRDVLERWTRQRRLFSW